MSASILLEKEREELSLNKNNDRYSVVFHNDAFTPVIYVFYVLVNVFEKTMDEAASFIHYVERNGKGALGPYDIDAAYEKVDEVEKLNEETGEDLILTVEKVEE